MNDTKFNSDPNIFKAYEEEEIKEFFKLSLRPQYSQLVETIYVYSPKYKELTVQLLAKKSKYEINQILAGLTPEIRKQVEEDLEKAQTQQEQERIEKQLTRAKAKKREAIKNKKKNLEAILKTKNEAQQNLKTYGTSDKNKIIEIQEQQEIKLRNERLENNSDYLLYKISLQLKPLVESNSSAIQLLEKTLEDELETARKRFTYSQRYSKDFSQETLEKISKKYSETEGLQKAYENWFKKLEKLPEYSQGNEQHLTKYQVLLIPYLIQFVNKYNLQNHSENKTANNTLNMYIRQYNLRGKYELKNTSYLPLINTILKETTKTSNLTEFLQLLKGKTRVNENKTINEILPLLNLALEDYEQALQQKLIQKIESKLNNVKGYFIVLTNKGKDQVKGLTKQPNIDTWIKKHTGKKPTKKPSNLETIVSQAHELKEELNIKQVISITSSNYEALLRVYDYPDKRMTCDFRIILKDTPSNEDIALEVLGEVHEIFKHNQENQLIKKTTCKLKHLRFLHVNKKNPSLEEVKKALNELLTYESELKFYGVEINDNNKRKRSKLEREYSEEDNEQES